MAPIKKPQSSYLIFCNARRKEVTEANPGLRIGEIQKILSAQWKELTDEEREHFNELARKDKERYEQVVRDNPVVVEEAAEENDETMQQLDANACIYPLGRVKKVIQTDSDAGKVSRDALIAIAKASELFAQFLATKSYENALYANKRQIKPSDITRAIQTHSVLDWLRDDFPHINEKKTASAASNTAATAKTTIPSTGSAGHKSISSFFAAENPVDEIENAIEQQDQEAAKEN